ncbi:MAG: type II toxin-antitoxin system HicA family toxin [Clostridiales Family XIII bacterium]|jgi:predicted RNA binding protein YcfA (HicA-like mRNA interferase family)|nr:type II toxin-antitoxin system HicA family toxin [Clostridiales Family XIII bacterium]
MNNRELRKKLQDAGWQIKSGKEHDQATHSEHPGEKIPIPRHKGEVPKGTANAILKAAGLK